MKTRVIIAGLVMLLTACSSGPRTHMKNDELVKMIESGHPPLVIDVRSRYEYDQSHVPGAIHIPFWKAFTTDALDQYKSTEKMVLYCEHGPRAGIAKFGLSTSGFENMVYLDGHMSAWKQANLPVEQSVSESEEK